MLFNSTQFLLFFAVFYCIYLIVRRHVKLRNIVLLIGSYVFYGTWNWHFLGLIIFSTLVDYNVGKRLARYDVDTPEHQVIRKRLLWLSVVSNIGVLALFKYFNFFADSFVDLSQLIGLQVNPITLDVLLPIGISFYTFQTLSYTFDVYRGQLKAIDSLLDFATFVAFFPQLVAGPIERASNLLPQIQSRLPIQPHQLHAGLYLILWGLFQKTVVADNAALIVTLIFDNNQSTGLEVLIAILAFTFQIYGDFSGYTDIARGVAKLLGFELMVNFRLPYFSLNPSDFWNRWHISLSTWLRDYLYIPLGGNRMGRIKTYRNLMITMVLGGLWHGAAWNFVIWGFYHGVILILYRLFERKPMHRDPWSGNYNYLIVILKMLLMFGLTLLGWFIFRLQSFEQVTWMVQALLDMNMSVTNYIGRLFTVLRWHLVILLVFNLWQYRRRNLLIVLHQHWAIQILIYCFLLTWMVAFGARFSVEFIYFQF
jgi:alginate O-acetyltransferase complex protein AlgI